MNYRLWRKYIIKKPKKTVLDNEASRRRSGELRNPLPFIDRVCNERLRWTSIFLLNAECVSRVRQYYFWLLCEKTTEREIYNAIGICNHHTIFFGDLSISVRNHTYICEKWLEGRGTRKCVRTRWGTHAYLYTHMRAWDFDPREKTHVPPAPDDVTRLRDGHESWRTARCDCTRRQHTRTHNIHLLIIPDKAGHFDERSDSNFREPAVDYICYAHCGKSESFITRYSKTWWKKQVEEKKKK